MTDRNAFMYDSSGKLKPEYDLKEQRRIQAGQSGLPITDNPMLKPQAYVVAQDVKPTPVPPVSVSLGPTVYIPKEKEGIPAHKFLEDASTVMRQRAQLRDKPEGERSMEAIVNTFNALTGKRLTEAEGWEFMILLKMVRGRQGKFNEDDYTDGAAYFGLLGECESKKR